MHRKKQCHSYYRRLSALKILFEAQTTEWTQNLGHHFYFSSWELGKKQVERRTFALLRAQLWKLWQYKLLRMDSNKQWVLWTIEELVSKAVNVETFSPDILT